MSLTLTKADFYDSHALSRQVEAPKLAPAIEDALLLDVRPYLSAELLEQVLGLTAFVALEWPVVLPDQLPGSFAIRRERVYKALTAQPKSDVPADATSTSDWQYQPLHTLWLLYLKPYWKQAAWSRFLLGHGYNIEKAGITMPSDPAGTFQAAGAPHRAGLQAAASNQADTLLNRLLRYVRQSHSTEGDCTPCHSHRNRRRKIRGV